MQGEETMMPGPLSKLGSLWGTRRKRLLLMASGALIAMAIVMLLVLRFGNPQMHRWVYQFQAYVSPGWSGEIPWPGGYSGIWRTWRTNGMPMTEYELENGRVVRRLKYRWHSGTPSEELRHDENGWVHGEYRAWHIEKDVLMMESHFRHGFLHGLHVGYDLSGKVVARKWYFMGHEVDERDYAEWSERGPPAWVFQTPPPGTQPLRYGSSLTSPPAPRTSPK
ncbi:MAG: toxin-antitoxin system YwqK family antitoxin [Planctomycetota bacterium]|jgi:hypothetical protein